MSPPRSPHKVILPPETIEQIIVTIIFTDDLPESRRATFQALTILSRDWYLEARRLELLRLDVSKGRLGRLIRHLTTLQEDDLGFRRFPSRWLSVDLTHSEDTPYEKLAKLFNILDMSGLQDLVITGRANNDPDTEVALLPPTTSPRITHIPTTSITHHLSLARKAPPKPFAGLRFDSATCLEF